MWKICKFEYLVKFKTISLRMDNSEVVEIPADNATITLYKERKELDDVLKYISLNREEIIGKLKTRGFYFYSRNCRAGTDRYEELEFIWNDVILTDKFAILELEDQLLHRKPFKKMIKTQRSKKVKKLLK